MWCKRIDKHYAFMWVAKRSGNRYLPNYPKFNSRRTQVQWHRDNCLERK
jgi:hypothetical protein